MICPVAISQLNTILRFGLLNDTGKLSFINNNLSNDVSVGASKFHFVDGCDLASMNSVGNCCSCGDLSDSTLSNEYYIVKWAFE